MTLPSRMNALVGHQLSRWEESGRPAWVPPCIAIASLPGAGGEELGRLVAEQLGYGLSAARSSTRSHAGAASATR
jgi:hypothetical protein